MSKKNKGLAGLAEELGSVTESTPKATGALSIVRPDGATAPTVQTVSHPVRTGNLVAKPSRGALLLHPRLIKERGHYVRELVRDEDFEALKAGIVEAGKPFGRKGRVLQSILVRTEGQGAQLEYVLVDGKRRLHGSLDLDLDEVPVENLGHITEAQAWEFQIMANELGRSTNVVDAAEHLLVMKEKNNADTKVLIAITGYSEGKIREYIRLARLLRLIPPALRAKARASKAVSWRALRRILQANPVEFTTDAFTAALEALIAGGDPDAQDEAEANTPMKRGAGGVLVPATPTPKLSAPAKERGRPKTFVFEVPDSTACERASGKGFATRAAWRDVHIEREPEKFLTEVSDYLHRLAADAIERYRRVTGRDPRAEDDNLWLAHVTDLAAAGRGLVAAPAAAPTTRKPDPIGRGLHAGPMRPAGTFTPVPPGTLAPDDE